jgi:hypothetical protein
MDCSFVATTSYILGFNFSSDGVRQPISRSPTSNFISTPQAQAVGVMMVDDQAGDGTWSIVADSSGGISFAHTSSCDDAFALDFDLYLNYTGANFLGVSDSLNFGNKGDVYVIGESQIVVIGWVHGVNGNILGVRKIVNFNAGFSFSSSDAIVGSGSTENAGTSLIFTKQSGFSIDADGTVTAISQVGGGGDGAGGSFRGMLQLELQKPLVGSRVAGILLNSYSDQVNGVPYQASASFFPTADPQFRTLQIDLDTRDHLWWSFSTTTQPAQQYLNSTTFVYVTAHDITGRFALQKIAMFKEQPFSGPQKIVSVSGTWSFYQKAYLPMDDIFVERVLGNQGTRVSQMVGQAQGSAFGVIDFDLTAGFDIESTPDSSAYSSDTEVSDCSMSLGGCEASKLCNLYPFGKTPNVALTPTSFCK